MGIYKYIGIYVKYVKYVCGKCIYLLQAKARCIAEPGNCVNYEETFSKFNFHCHFK